MAVPGHHSCWVRELQSLGMAGLQDPVGVFGEKAEAGRGLIIRSRLPCWETQLFLKPLKDFKQMRVITSMIDPSKETQICKGSP